MYVIMQRKLFTTVHGRKHSVQSHTNNVSAHNLIIYVLFVIKTFKRTRKKDRK